MALFMTLLLLAFNLHSVSSSTTPESDNVGLIAVTSRPDSVSIADIAAKAGPVAGPSMDELISAAFKDRPETIQVSRRAHFNRKRVNLQPATKVQITEWGTQYVIIPGNRAADRVQMRLGGDAAFHGTSVTIEVASVHNCLNHRLTAWSQMNGRATDCSVLEAFQEIPAMDLIGHPLRERLLEQTHAVWQATDLQIDSITAPDFTMNLGDVFGDWVIVAATTANTLGYSYAIGGVNKQSQYTTQNGKAIGMAVLLTVKILISIVEGELRRNPGRLTNLDIYGIKILLDCLTDLFRQAVIAIEKVGNEGPAVTGLELGNALFQLGRGEVQGSGRRSRFVTLEEFNEDLEASLDCLASDLPSPGPE